ncbi:MAG: ATP-binding protein [Candidatus Taylorbacteria bacterium]|nr:ATP-binding protein [Candidatus Taylorbacteria bacterium]
MYIHRFADKKIEELLKSKKVLLVLGARQVGKTTSVQNYLKDRKSVYLNFDLDIDRNRFLASASLSAFDAHAYFGSPDYLALDEAQREITTARIVKGWFDSHVPMRVILLGSSSLNLLNQSVESLTGRNEKLFLTPFLFRELVECQIWFDTKLSHEALLASFGPQIRTLLMQSMVYGNYPEAVISEKREDFLLNLISDYLFKDILQLGLVKSPDQIKRLLLLLAHQVCSEVSINELSNSLDMSRQTVERYIDILEQAFVIFRLPAFSTNPRKEITKNQKIYFYDTGVRNALLKEFSMNESRSDIGALWENWVVAEYMKMNLLNGQPDNLYFWRSRSQSEVDLVIKGARTDDLPGGLLAYEIKWKRQGQGSRAFEDQYKVKVNMLHSEDPFVISRPSIIPTI